MTDIERAIDSAMHSINMLLKDDKINYENYAMLRDALQAKAERDKMRCVNCKLIDNDKRCDIVMNLCKNNDFAATLSQKKVRAKQMNRLTMPNDKGMCLCNGEVCCPDENCSDVCLQERIGKLWECENAEE
ncbi:MAG: hypothetical protein RR263_00600, partial [Oscillospiraceae bacterium]